MSIVQPLFHSIYGKDGTQVENLFFALMPQMTGTQIKLSLLTIRFPDRDLGYYADMLSLPIEAVQLAYDTVIVLKKAVQS